MTSRLLATALAMLVATGAWSTLSCSSVLGLDEPTHRSVLIGSGGAGQAGSSEPAIDASATGGSAGTAIAGSGGIAGASASGGNGGASTAGAGQSSSDASADVLADVGKVDAGPRCNDGLKNGNETGSDCGGSCGGCPTGSSCKVTSDCLSKTCMGMTCQRAPCNATPNCRCVGPMPGISNYLVCNPAKSWDSAKIECENLGMHLAKINDKAEATFLSGNLDPAFRDYWVGAIDPSGDPTKWQWLDNTPIPNDLWVTGTVMSSNYRCAAATIPPGLIIGICGQELGYICEID